MIEQKEILLNEAEQELANDDYNSFAKKIKELYDSYITCNCFFESKSSLFWLSLLRKVQVWQDNFNDFNLNFTKGFIYYQCKKEEEALKYFSIAIELNPISDICYALRSIVQQNIWDSIKDAEQAVSINLSARNSFVLAGSINENNKNSLGYNIDWYHDYSIKNIERGIKRYQKAISLNNNFPCAYFNMGRLFEAIEYYVEAIEAYIICIKLKPSHWCYYNLWFCFYQIKKYDLASHYLDIGMSNNPNDYRFFFALGLQYDELNNYEKAIESYKSYLSMCSVPECPVLGNLDEVQNRFLYSFLNKANAEFDTANYLQSIQNFEHYFFLGGKQTETISNTYYTAVLFYKHPEKLINNSNTNYIRLNSFWQTYESKKYTNDILSIDEENFQKLIKYQKNFKIGFGAYQGLEIEKILDVDAEYIFWCIINLHHFMISMNLFSASNFHTEINFYEALEINLIKGKILAEKQEELKEEREQYVEDYHNTYDEWMCDEFDDDAETAHWNMD